MHEPMKVMIRLDQQWSSVGTACIDVDDPTGVTMLRLDLRAMSPQLYLPLKDILALEEADVYDQPLCISDEGLLEEVGRWPGIGLRQLCAVIWPQLSWIHVTETCFVGEGPQRQTLAQWMRDRMQGLIDQGRVLLAPCQKDMLADSEGPCYQI